MIPLVIKMKNVKCNNGHFYNICGSKLLKNPATLLDTGYLILDIGYSLSFVFADPVAIIQYAVSNIKYLVIYCRFRA